MIFQIFTKYIKQIYNSLGYVFDQKFLANFAHFCQNFVPISLFTLNIVLITPPVFITPLRGGGGGEARKITTTAQG